MAGFTIIAIVVVIIIISVKKNKKNRMARELKEGEAYKFTTTYIKNELEKYGYTLDEGHLHFDGIIKLPFMSAEISKNGEHLGTITFSDYYNCFNYDKDCIKDGYNAEKAAYWLDVNDESIGFFCYVPQKVGKSGLPWLIICERFLSALSVGYEKNYSTRGN